MKLFIDTANLSDIEEALRGGFIRGITTNPSLLAKEPKGNYIEHLKKIVALAVQYGGESSLSVEVFSNDKKEMVLQAEQFQKELQYKNLAIKIPISFKGVHNLDVVKELTKKGIIVNCTACMTPMQLMMAASSGAKYVSLFYNRLKDSVGEEQFQKDREALFAGKMVDENDYDPNNVLRETKILLKDYPNAEIIVGSIRNVLDVKQSALAGGDIVTASLKILKEAIMHFKTDDSVEKFLKDFESWIG